MIILLGTGHVFRIAESVTFIVKNSWPDALFIELDEGRLNALIGPPNPDTEPRTDLPKSYLKSAEYQNKMSSKNDTQTGGEMYAAILVAQHAGARIVCIDRDAAAVMREMEEEMSLGEKIKYSMSSISDNLFGQRKVKKTQDQFSANEEEFINNMRKRYPTFIRKLIDERDEYMAKKIRENLKEDETTVIVVGDAHVEGLLKLLPDLDIKTIRLADLLDPERLEKVKDKVWNNKWNEESE